MIKIFHSYSLDQKKILVIAWLTNNQIKQSEFIKPFSNIYTKFFSTNDHIYEFFYSINFILFIFSIFFLYYSIRDIFEFNKEISVLISLNTLFFPLFIIYFLSFYKEPFILICFLSLLANAIYLFKKKFFIRRIVEICFFYNFSLFFFILLNHIKNEYFFIVFLSFLISILFIIVFTKLKILHLQLFNCLYFYLYLSILVLN